MSTKLNENILFSSSNETENEETILPKAGFMWGLLSGAFWGLNGVMLGLVSQKAPLNKEMTSSQTLSLFLIPFAIICLHDGIASFWLILNNLIKKQDQSFLQTLKTRSGKVVIIGALFGGPFAMTGYLFSMSLIPSAYTMAITAAYPALGAFLGGVFLGEKLSVRDKIGIFFCILGPFFIGFNDLSMPSLSSQNILWQGILLAFIPTIGWALEGVISTYAMEDIDSSHAITIRQLTSFFTYLFIGIPFFVGSEGYQLMKIVVSDYTSSTFSFLALTAFVGALSYLFWYHSMSMIGVSRGMALNITYALWGIPFGMMLSDLEFSFFLVIGALLITLGAFLIVTNTKKETVTT